MASSTDPIIIIGAGMAGLACATWLHRAGRPVLLLEAADAVGGRVRTDLTPDGFRLDRGFQILLNNYPEARRMFDYGALNLKSFRSGAVVRLANGQETTLENPLHAPLMAFAALASPIGTTKDKLLLGKLVAQLAGRAPEQLLARPGTTTLAYLRSFGWSEQIITNFFRPFFGGVYLDRELGTASNFFEFVFQQFAQGAATVPALGMQQLPEQLASRLPAGTIRLNTPVAAVAEGGRLVHLASGEALAAAAVVLATEGPAAARLLGADLPAPARPVARLTTCTYFATAGAAPSHGYNLLHLNARPGALVHNVAFPAETGAALAPAGQSLVSVSTHGEHGLTEDALTARLRAELAAWFGPVANMWRHLRTYRIEQALPIYGPGQPAQQELRLGDTLFRCGDWVSYPSLNAALGTGRQVAELIMS
ncbi:protoporphyrinogen/coproporphyrinogen oxidase [Hymenobacter cheonanensis]|uniref:protoporphyrinogen/coproporphyrinogen oxidase n=1 Tax=Hymenobacter sp. CA2-7 TaxID=3063993 RepID=UPI0027125509|nr:NAD(P)/FAD-dependent oxidoreductase [Hymenobacter sp. CA2-7]MDO7885470.1 NAD(P)/FAD-dependent oxidoreductase [Hymenobacter sp. CA2-7]